RFEMRICTTILFLLGVALAQRPECALPEPIVNELAARFAFEKGLGVDRRAIEHFTVVKSGDVVYMRHDTPSHSYDPNLRPVFVFIGSQMEDGLNCPSGAPLSQCFSEWIRNAPQPV